jgi:hypothetical protein
MAFMVASLAPLGDAEGVGPPLDILPVLQVLQARSWVCQPRFGLVPGCSRGLSGENCVVARQYPVLTAT